VADQVEIANLALQEVGAEPITSLADDTATARAVNLRFGPTRDQFLRTPPWNFATGRSKLALLEEPPAFGFDKAFALPSDWLRTRHVLTDSSQHPEHQIHEPHYQIEGGNLLADHDEIFMIYTRRETNTEKWDTLATDAFVLLLASRIARVITQNFNLAETLDSSYRVKLQEARTVNSTDDPARRIEADEWLASRFHTSGAGLGPGGVFRDIDT